MATRNKSPNRLMRDEALRRWKYTETNSPVAKVWPSGIVATLAARAGTSRPRVNRWLHDPDLYPLDWPELCEVATELGGSLRCMFSVKHT